MKIRLWLPLVGLCALMPGRAFAWDFNVTTSGNTILVNVSGMDNTKTPQNTTCAGASADVPRLGGSCGIPGASFATISLTCNSVGSHVVFVNVYDSTTGGQYESRQTTVTVTDPPPSTCPQFDLVVRGTTVLTHKYADAIGWGATYPSGQTTDGEIGLYLRPRAAPAGSVIYLKVIDPAQTAAYGPQQPDDNVDSSSGTINGAKTANVTLPQTGIVDLVLRTTLHAAGDNYRVQASADPSLATDPNFVCSPANGCQTTPVITVWKRLYLETNEMYRNSQLIAWRVLPGDRFVYVNNRGFGRNDRVRLIHAPSFLRTAPGDPVGFYDEDHVVRSVRRNQNQNIPAAFEIELENPAGVMGSYKTEAPIAGVQLGDAIVNLGRNDPFFHMDEQYVSAAFADAFVEVVKIGTNGVGMPFYDAMTNNAMIFAGAKWFSLRETTAAVSNAGLAVAGGTRAPLPQAPDALSLGTTTGPYSYVWRQNIDDATSGPRSRYPLTSGHNPQLTSGEVLVHELAHQWNVNPNYVDHECDKNSYTFPTKYCQMNSPENSAQYDDGQVKFHYVGSAPRDADSEYMTIRKAGEPRP